MAIIKTELWNSPTFSIERIEGHAPHTLIYRITGPFNARDMYGSMKQVALGNIFDFKPPTPAEPPKLHIFDISAVPQMDSSALGTIVSHYISCRAKGIRVVAVAPSPNVIQLFKFTKVDSLIPTAASLEAALAG
jgi:ABC-type transporter Mla MlaB component